MEYLVIAGAHLKESLSDPLGDFAPFFWNVVVPVGLALGWLAAVHALWETWRPHRKEEEERSGVITKLAFTLVLFGLILGCGTGLEYLVLGYGYLHAQVLNGVLTLVHVQ